MVALRREEFHRELMDLTTGSFTLVLDVERFLAFFGGPWPPFVGDVFTHSFRLRRNWRLLMCSYQLTGTFEEKDGKTEIIYKLAPDKFWFYIIRILGLTPFLAVSMAIITSMALPGIILGLLLPIGGYFFLSLIDRLLGKRLNTIFTNEVAIMPYNHNSRFQH